MTARKNPSVHARPALTPDIVVRGRMPTKGQYDAALRLLREVAAKGAAGLSAMRATTLDDQDEYEGWVALSQNGLVRSRRDGQWDVVLLTPRGERYLAERADYVPGRKNPAPALDKKKLRKEIEREQRKEARAKVARMKAEAKATCAAGRVDARAAGLALKEKAKEDARLLREGARSSCSSKKADVDAERKFQRDLRRIEAANKALAKRQRAGGRVKRSESDDEVRANIPPELVYLFERVRGQIKGSARKSRTEAFLEYAEAHPGEEYEAIEDATDALVADLERQQREGRINPRAAWTSLGKLTRLTYEDKGGKERAIRFGLRTAPELVYDAASGKPLVIAYAPSDVRDATPEEVKRYRKTHWGEDGRRVVSEGVCALPPFEVLGKGLAITYTTRKGAEGSGELADWVHPWGEGSRGKWVAPLVVAHVCKAPRCSNRGRVALRGGSYRVTARGIVG